MASQIVVLALIFVAIVGCVSAQAPATTPTTSQAAAAPVADATTPSGSAAALTPGSDAGALSPTEGSANSPVDSPVGNTDDIAASVPAPEPSTKKSGASSLGFSAVTGAAAVAGYFLF
ncbi:classical arabinogalactan protein 11-like [Macadamia integrifolia]|uniref:classical arabinogalactan protein 11-like n=1 Tax=Macadamia integrifolia TaxID=60698 RepID=UPI001C4FB5E2|nr:classical arabinogalactan protein 11-like [Macadamia integrifolia]